MCSLICFLEARGVSWVVEQPRSSILWVHHRFQDILRKFTVYRVPVELAKFGAASNKPLTLMTNRAWMVPQPPTHGYVLKPIGEATLCHRRPDTHAHTHTHIYIYTWAWMYTVVGIHVCT